MKEKKTCFRCRGKGKLYRFRLLYCNESFSVCTKCLGDIAAMAYTNHRQEIQRKRLREKAGEELVEEPGIL